MAGTWTQTAQSQQPKVLESVLAPAPTYEPPQPANQGPQPDQALRPNDVGQPGGPPSGPLYTQSALATMDEPFIQSRMENMVNSLLGYTGEAFVADDPEQIGVPAAHEMDSGTRMRMLAGYFNGPADRPAGMLSPPAAGSPAATAPTQVDPTTQTIRPSPWAPVFALVAVVGATVIVGAALVLVRRSRLPPA